MAKSLHNGEVAGAFLINYLLCVRRYQHAVQNMAYDHADASDIPNGFYNGECDVDFIYAKVAVTVENGTTPLTGA